MDLIYRRAVLDDASSLEVLDRRYFSYPHTIDQFLFEINDNCHIIFVAVENETIIGYIGLQYVVDEGYISNVVVDSAYRKQGIGDMLVKRVISFAKDNNLSFISLEVRKNNIDAINLYSKNNFIKEGILKNYYSNPKDDALIMTNRCLN